MNDKNAQAIDPTPIMQMMNAYWASQVLHAATKLGFFTALEGKNLTAREAAKSMNLPEASVEKLLNACCALKLMSKENGKYSNSDLSETFLVKGKKGYYGAMVSHMGELYDDWGKLDEAVKNNAPVSERFGGERRGSDEAVRGFTLAMHANSSLSAPLLANVLDLSSNKKLLDIGGGSGINSIVLAERNPQLEAVVFDLPAVVKISEEFISKSDAADRITVHPGDFTEDDLPRGCDCMLLSHILHAEGEEGSKALLKKCYDALEPSGKIIIVDFIPDDAKDSPVFPVLFALNMLVVTPKGDTFSIQEINGLLKDSGFTEGELKTLGESLPATVVMAKKP